MITYMISFKMYFIARLRSICEVKKLGEPKIISIFMLI